MGAQYGDLFTPFSARLDAWVEFPLPLPTRCLAFRNLLNSLSLLTGSDKKNRTRNIKRRFDMKEGNEKKLKTANEEIGKPSEVKFGNVSEKKKFKTASKTKEENAIFKILEESKKEVKPGFNVGVFFINDKTGALLYQMSDATYYFKKRVMDELGLMCRRDEFKMFYDEQTKTEIDFVQRQVIANKMKSGVDGRN